MALSHRPSLCSRRCAWGPVSRRSAIAAVTAISCCIAAAPEVAALEALPHSRVNTSKQAQSEPVPVSIPSLPTSLPAAITPAVSGISELQPGPNDSLGIGHLRPDGTTNAARADWLRGVILPIYPSPSGDPWGWLVNGWLIPNGSPALAIGRDAAFSMVETDTGLFTFPVLELRPDGWFRFQYTSAGDAWAHVDHLRLGSVPLTIDSWEVSMKTASRVAFRRPGLSQPMRLAPSERSSLQALVSSSSIIQPLDIDGDWLQVRVTQPAQGCTPLPGASTSEGWVRWRSTADVPLVWFADNVCQSPSWADGSATAEGESWP